MRRATLGALFVLLAIAAAGPITSFDYFWHLATGRWIVEHGAIPKYDPFTVASERIDWINGQWLAQVSAWLLYRAGGHALVSFARTILAAALFTFLAVWIARSRHTAVAAAVASLSFAGAFPRLGVRPEILGIVCCVAVVALLLKPGRWTIALYAVITIAWMNLHPSALLAPAIAFLWALGSWFDDPPESRVANARRNLTIGVVAAIALLVNPWGLRGVTAPLALAQQASGGAFVNLEWLPTSPLRFPLFYAALVAAAIVMFFRARSAARLMLLAFFAALAIRYVRNHGFFFAVLPLLIEPSLPSEIRSKRGKSTAAVAAALAVVTVIVAAVPLFEPLGPDPRRFPLHAVEKLRQLNFTGNIHNPDQFGGFLIWSFYPERRVLTDGRNELYRSFIHEQEVALRDSRAWNALLKRYRIDVAVDEHRPPLKVLDARTGRETSVPASLAFWPRREWALVAFDDVAMVFVRRAAFDPARIAAVEIREEKQKAESRKQK